MYEFGYHAAAQLDDARAAFADGEDPQYLAGGMTLLPTMKQRLAAPSNLIDLDAIPGLKGILVDETTVTIGAMTCHADVAADPQLRAAVPALSELANLIGDAQVRNRGTLGGSIANNDPAADYPAAVLGLEATITTDQRALGADEFFVDMFTTGLEEGEIIKSVTFKRPQRAAYQKFPNPASRYAIVGVMVAQFGATVSVAVTGAGASVFRMREFEAALETNFDPNALDPITVDSRAYNEDLHADAAYRAQLVKVMAKRAVSLAR